MGPRAGEFEIGIATELYKNIRFRYLLERTANELEPSQRGQPMSEAIFRGFSGRLHRFSVHRPNEMFGSEPGVYCFARPGPGGRGWTPLFLSRTGNLSKRLASHEQWPEAQLLGATHVLVHQSDERDAREYVEADLAQSLKPAMNGPFLDAELVEEADTGVVRMVWAA